MRPKKIAKGHDEGSEVEEVANDCQLGEIISTTMKRHYITFFSNLSNSATSDEDVTI